MGQVQLEGQQWRWKRTPLKVRVQAWWEETVVENKAGKVGGKVRMEIAVEVVVERLDVEAVDDERLVVEIGDAVGEVLLLLGWRVWWLVDGVVRVTGGKLEVGWWGVRWASKNLEVWAGNVDCRRGLEVGQVPELWEARSEAGRAEVGGVGWLLEGSG